MRYTFQCWGHPNIRALHTRTIEFTKDHTLTERGDCIIGIKADFRKEELKRFSRKVRIIVEAGDLTDRFKAYVNPRFDDDREMVLRKSRHRSGRTFATDLNRGSNKLDRDIVELMRDPETKMKVTVESMGRDHGKS